MSSAALRIVLADDETAVVDALRELLGDCGYDVVGSAADGNEAVAAVARLQPDILISDLRMPNMTGFEAARALRQRGSDLPIIIFSAYDDPGLLEEAERIPVSAFLVKGCPSRELLAVIDAAVRAA